MSSSGNSGSGAGDQIDGDSDGTFAEKGISAANGCTITVDNTGNLIMIDRSGNITVIDRGRKYGLAEGEDGIIIADENGDCVRLEDDGLTVVYPDGAGGEKHFRLPDEAETAADTTAYDDAGTVPGKTKGHGVLIAVCASSAARSYRNMRRSRYSQKKGRIQWRSGEALMSYFGRCRKPEPQNK